MNIRADSGDLNSLKLQIMKKLPLAGNSKVVTQNLGEELLIYNLITHKAYCLNKTSAIIYQACDGKTSVDELRKKYKFTDDLIYFALDDLRSENLIENYQTDSHFGNLSRREVIRKVGLSTMIALPMISSLVAPTAIEAASATCNVGSVCACSVPNDSGLLRLCTSYLGGTPAGCAGLNCDCLVKAYNECRHFQIPEPALLSLKNCMI